MGGEEKHLLCGILRANTMASVCSRPEKGFHGTPATRARGNALIHLRSGGRGLLNGWKECGRAVTKEKYVENFKLYFFMSLRRLVYVCGCMCDV